MQYSIIVAHDDKGGIGSKGSLPWPFLSKDLIHFKDITTYTRNKDKKNVVIMGRNTWNSLPLKVKPLPGRINIILSSTLSLDSTSLSEKDDKKEKKEKEEKSVYIFKSLKEACYLIETELKEKVEQVFIIGGSLLYQEALPLCSIL